eukprot:448043-Rhodomonas_salina.2
MHSGSTHKRPNFRGNRKLYQGGAFLCMISGILVLGFGEGLAQDVRDKESLGLLYQDAVQYREILVPYTTSVPEDPTPRTGRSDPSTILLYCTILPPYLPSDTPRPSTTWLPRDLGQNWTLPRGSKARCMPKSTGRGIFRTNCTREVVLCLISQRRGGVFAHLRWAALRRRPEAPFLFLHRHQHASQPRLRLPVRVPIMSATSVNVKRLLRPHGMAASKQRPTQHVS